MKCKTCGKNTYHSNGCHNCSRKVIRQGCRISTLTGVRCSGVAVSCGYCRKHLDLLKG